MHSVETVLMVGSLSEIKHKVFIFYDCCGTIYDRLKVIKLLKFCFVSITITQGSNTIGQIIKRGRELVNQFYTTGFGDV